MPSLASKHRYTYIIIQKISIKVNAFMLQRVDKIDTPGDFRKRSQARKSEADSTMVRQ